MTEPPKPPRETPGPSIDTPRKRKEHAVLAAEMIAISAAIDAEIGSLLAFLLGANATPVIAAYQEIKSDRAKVQMVSAALGTALNDVDRELLGDVMSIASSAQKARHRVAHWLWAYDENDPDNIYLWDPDLLLQIWERMHHLKDGENSGALRKPAAIVTLSLKDMERQRSQLELGLTMLHSFRAVMTDSDRDAADELRRLLSTAPPIVERQESRERDRQRTKEARLEQPRKSPKE